MRRFLALVGVLSVAGRVWAAGLEPWQRKALDELCGKYLSSTTETDATDAVLKEWLDRVFLKVGGRLSTQGLAAAPAEDLAMMALLQTRFGKQTQPAPAPVALPTPTPSPVPSSPAQTPARQQVMSDISKGQEGLRQAQERLAEMPLTERMVITGDVISGLQAATVQRAPELTSMIGRARVNFVLRAFTADPAKGLGAGYFFVQMRAAGGPPDASGVGGPRSFSALNDISTDGSRFNESTSRGNLYLGKAFYEQGLQLGDNSLMGRVGIIDLSDFFDTNLFANNEARQFINSAFVNGAAYKTGISAPGFMGEYYRKMDRDWLEAIVLRGGYAVSRIERAFTSPIWSGELELQTRWRGRRGHWRMGGAVGNRAGEGSINGFHLSVDHWVAPRIGVFGRYNISNGGRGSLSFGPVRQSYSGGVQMRFAGTGDTVSAWSAGFSQAFGIAADEPLASERVLETYYRWQWTRNISFTPDFQFVLGSGGRRSGGTHAVFGARLNFAF